MDKWSLVDRVTRRITSTISKNGCMSHKIDIPDEYYRLLCNIDVNGQGKDIQIVVLKNTNGDHLISLCGIDDFRNTISALNKE